MLARSYFYGFECLLFLVAVHFAIIYIVTNYVSKGYLLKWDVLSTVAGNLFETVVAIGAAMLFALLEIYTADAIIHTLGEKLGKSWVWLYCGLWLVGSVVGGWYLISGVRFYFTDRIFVVVVSWTFPVKTASYCLDRIAGCQVASLSHKLKFMVSPLVIYRDFVAEHEPSLPIHTIYLIAKSLTAGVCLLINYILLTEIIMPFLLAAAFEKMSFLELSFRLTPLLFYVQMCLYYLIMENIMLAMAEITQLRHRVFYSDWWNAETVSEYLDKWVLIVNSFSDRYLPFSKRTKHALHVSIIFLMLFGIFSHSINSKMILFASVNILIVYFLGDNKKIQSNYVVHVLTVCFQPFCLALALKYGIFS
jgi:hypothetical protein